MTTLRALLDQPSFRPVNGSMPIGQRFRNLRHNYGEHAKRVQLGLATWDAREDVYELGDWSSLFTPIEAAVWGDIRAAGLALWPQLPVAGYFVDFGNPEHRIALECDGKKWHDAERDAARDEDLNRQGWRVFRAPGWLCLNTVHRPEDWPEIPEEDRQAYAEKRSAQTMAGIIDQIRRHMEASR